MADSITNLIVHSLHEGDSYMRLNINCGFQGPTVVARCITQILRQIDGEPHQIHIAFASQEWNLAVVAKLVPVAGESTSLGCILLQKYMMTHRNLTGKLRGCMLGTLLGDCLGAPFEGESGTRVVVHRYFDKLDGPYVKQPRKQYTDDTAMTKSVAKCLTDKPTMDFKLLAKLFVKEYFSEPRRGYGENVVEVFHKLRGNKFEDVYKPAREQFAGTGSYGNGAAMRVAPVALFFHDDYKQMIDTATKASEITHTHKLGVCGALLQCIAIEQSLQLHPNERADHHAFTKNLIDKMKEIEAKDDMSDLNDPAPYQTQLKVVQQLLSVQPPEEPISEEGVAAILGNSVSALHSVPTAIYCYLRAQNNIPDINSDNIFRRTIEYAVSLGGDTDTIAAMAGSIAGAHLGEEYVSENLLRHCEYVDEMLELADNLLTQCVAPQVRNRATEY